MGKRIKIIGIGDEGPSGLPASLLETINKAEILAGGARHLSMFEGHPGEKLELGEGISVMVERLDRLRLKKEVVVLASGDPLFCGIAGYMTKRLGPDSVDVYPYVSSLQLAFAKMGESWQDALLDSVHGRPLKGLAQRIGGREKIALLTDPVNNPAAIARYLLDFGMTEYEAFVAENLGGDREICGFWKLEELAEADCSPLSVVILRRRVEAEVSRFGFGIEDEEFHQRRPDQGLLTKREIRVVSLSELKLRENSIVWDIGAGSGSVAVECALTARNGQVFAIEKNREELANMERNRIKFRADFTAIHSKAPEGLEALPDPDAVFIGGSGGELRELLRICCSRLQAEGRIVVNAATIETLYETRQALAEQGFDSRATLMQVSRSAPIMDKTRFVGLNPIYIITGFRQPGKVIRGGTEQS
ncbi:precorrin-6y C5,15-methyltransferase (decarboxylating) subunit CbiE [Paenibacillus sp. HN-1]|uniref:precorrin-6y C5,15-methyltransferase (decarboxylating) subunit CbiE n=1 Tax=Paenibacillus TaxID=44249 RepID=UPI001CA8E80C|nr:MULTISPECIES: precorrin-6y C5,15-methyltransferase (decarboxylating) subunit CbiE [Paenibacillus]MBY9078144.1 precorrin-6y C5,15-methyltransferase (decarboxylating) subunit CbiE [Paenibacillus sp. CGMCC 1.18879]MBY9083885.1 precorrin-6y C5,15-methyltransferase (decarboxylating) subunit CbiE [Paenibacillus sinensis]